MSNQTITIRRAARRDQATLERLAGLDSTVLPEDDFLIAQVGDELWAAIGLSTGTMVADPFRPSADVAKLLRMRIGHEGGETAPAPRSTPLVRRFAHRVAT